ncbi:MAG TPA: RDD family protein [Longimicrobium sp.]|nr:RDD family protein [Longimicrobium sp.]
MDPQNQTRNEAQGGPAYAPPVYAQQQPVAAGAQPDLAKRAIAAVIDFVGIGFAVGVLNVILGIALGRFGLMAAAAVGTAAVLLRDIALQGRSPGKKIMGLNVVNAAGGPITADQSVKRNATLALSMIGSVVAAVPFIGWLIAMVFYVAGFGLSLYEVYLVATGKPRLGDNIAGTHVVAEGQAAIAL